MESELLNKICIEVKRLGITPDKIEIVSRWQDNTPYIVVLSKIHKNKIKVLNNKIVEIMSIYKLDQRVKEKYGEKPKDKAWVQFGAKFNFKGWYLKQKIKRYIEILNKYVSELGFETDFKERRKTPDEIKQELKKGGHIL